MTYENPNLAKRQELKILVVDDDDHSLKAIEFCLTPLGYDCTQDTVPEHALELYKNKGFDIVITDMQMPGMNGIDLLKALRAFDKKARVIIMTGYGDLETAKAAINNKAYGFLGKPIDVADIYELIRDIETEIYQQKNEEIERLRLKEAFSDLTQIYKKLLTHLKSMDTECTNDE